MSTEIKDAGAVSCRYGGYPDRSRARRSAPLTTTAGNLDRSGAVRAKGKHGGAESQRGRLGVA